MSANYKRTSVYTSTDKSEPKYMFVWLCDHLASLQVSPNRILDVGSAAGDFLSYAQTRFPDARCEGVEYDAELVTLSQQRYSNIPVHQGDANRMDFLGSNSFNAVFLTGVHSIFDDFRPSFNECIRVAQQDGVVLITGLFNPYPLDARIHWRYPDNFDAPWHPGYNLFSKQSIGTFLTEHNNVKSFCFEKFSIPFDLLSQDDPVRSWTEINNQGARIFRNGIMPLNFELLTIHVNKSGENGV